MRGPEPVEAAKLLRKFHCSLPLLTRAAMTTLLSFVAGAAAETQTIGALLWLVRILNHALPRL